MEGEAGKAAGSQSIPVGLAHALRLLHLELQAHGQHEGVGLEVLVVGRQIDLTALELGIGLGAVAALRPHGDVELGGGQHVFAVSDRLRGILVGADGHIQQVQIGTVGVQAVNVGPHQLGAGRTGVASHLQHTVSHQLSHLDDGIHTDSLVSGVPPALVAGDDGAEGGHLVQVVGSQGAAGGAHGIGDIQQIRHVGESLGVALHGSLVAGVLQSDEGVIVAGIQGGIGVGSVLTLFHTAHLPGKALVMEGLHSGIHGGGVVFLVGVHAADIQRNGQAVVAEEADQLLSALNSAHEGEGQVGNAAVGVAQQILRNAHVAADIGLALHTVLEEQVGDAVGGLLQLQLRAVAQALGDEVHAPHHGVLAVLGSGHLHGHVGVGLQNDGTVLHFHGHLGSGAFGGGQPTQLGGSLSDGIHKRLVVLFHGIRLQGEDRPGGHLRGTAVDNILQGIVALPQGHVGAGADQAEGLAVISGQVHGDGGGNRLGVSHHHGEPGVGGVGRDGHLLPVQGLIAPVVVETGVGGGVGDIHIVQGVLLSGHTGIAILIATHNNTDTTVHGQPGLHQRLGGKEGSQSGTAVILDAGAVQPAILYIRCMIRSWISRLTFCIDPAFQLSFIIGSSGRIQVAQRHDHLGGIGITDLDVDIFVFLTLHHHGEASSLPQANFSTFRLWSLLLASVSGTAKGYSLGTLPAALEP